MQENVGCMRLEGYPAGVVEDGEREMEDERVTWQCFDVLLAIKCKGSWADDLKDTLSLMPTIL